MASLQAPFYPVVVIGNGPSGISLSNILSGNIPFFTGDIPHSPNSSEGLSLYDKCRRNMDVSIIDQDLKYLSEGLEGSPRSANPVSVLFDHLSQPNADGGLYQGSTLTWRLCRDRKIPHLVIGRGRCGGSWHSMQGSQLTVSLNNWLDLPGWTFQEWLKEHRKQLNVMCSTCPLVCNVQSEGNSYDRASTAHVAEYYEHYVGNRGLENNFENFVTITSIKRKENGNNFWEISGHKKIKCKQSSSKKSFCVLAENVVLAGGLPKPKKLNIEGESLPFVYHHLKKVVQVTEASKKLLTRNSSAPVLVVGDGLSAADAVLELYSHEIPVVHALRHDLNDEELILNKMSAQVYHDYAKVKDMMAHPVYGPAGNCLYQAYFKCQLISISKLKECKLKLADGKCQSLSVSSIFILIGSKPDLSFLKDLPSLGIDPSKDIDCRHNPIDINPYTYECKRAKNLFAMGPLVGDNFVRFGIGGALGIASHLLKYNRSYGVLNLL